MKGHAFIFQFEPYDYLTALHFTLYAETTVLSKLTNATDKNLFGQFTESNYYKGGVGYRSLIDRKNRLFVELASLKTFIACLQDDTYTSGIVSIAKKLISPKLDEEIPCLALGFTLVDRPYTFQIESAYLNMPHNINAIILSDFSKRIYQHVLDDYRTHYGEPF